HSNVRLSVTVEISRRHLKRACIIGIRLAGGKVQQNTVLRGKCIIEVRSAQDIAVERRYVIDRVISGTVCGCCTDHVLVDGIVFQFNRYACDAITIPVDYSTGYPDRSRRIDGYSDLMRGFQAAVVAYVCEQNV